MYRIGYRKLSLVDRHVHGARGGSLTMCLICDAGVRGAQVSAATGGWMNINFPRFTG
jgi:hypothetical protein